MKMSQPCTQNVDFLAQDFELIGEPLNLLEVGQEWFTNVYRSQPGMTGPRGIVLGATAWLGCLLCQTCERVVLVDRSDAMLEMAEGSVLRASIPEKRGSLQFMQGDWLSLPNLPGPVSIAVGDNAFLFLRYPDDWLSFCNELASRMHPGARLITRVPSVPPDYEPATVEEIIFRFIKGESINYTAVRTSLLFAHWDKLTYAINTEQVLKTFETNRQKFDALYRKFPVAGDDLTTVEKYRDSSAIYYAPPLDNILQVLRTRFRVAEVHFGQYPMAEHFPLIVAIRE